jgi:predicted GNAT family acetyltransferase
MATEVVQDAAMNRFELLVDGVQAGIADYLMRDDRIVFVHTEIDPAYRGQGLGDEIARGALNLVRAESDLRVELRCPFLSKWVAEHPEYEDLLTR